MGEPPGGCDPAEGTDLEYHGDRALAPGLLDLAVNVRVEPHPPWLADAVTTGCARLAAYPDATAATRAVAAHHGRPPGEVLLTAGAAEAFGLLARAVPPGPAVVVHPQFTEPERALRIAGHHVHRHLLGASDGFRLDPATVPADADLVVLGNPTNPTGVLHPVADLVALARPGRVLVVDEAFMDAVPGEPASLGGRGEVPGLVVVRSLTKTWGLAGLRIGYVLAGEPMIAALHLQQPPWSVSTPALAAASACTSERAGAQARVWAVGLDHRREALRQALVARGLRCVPASRGPFLLVAVPGGRDLTGPLRERGIAVRRGDTFPGLGSGWFRVAVRREPEHAALLAAIDAVWRQPAS
ncbi:MAG: threonine-phosphate decarboxylase [Dactylosporangium sp.]|nr:Rv2231c family pyridoxal phosphate-dependent protein CobC [Dactylosporangium sp.]NNJ63711.1 threonine-phosphate decarboxylase [Dactylosporangium sp.]